MKLKSVRQKVKTNIFNQVDIQAYSQNESHVWFHVDLHTSHQVFREIMHKVYYQVESNET